MNSMLLEAARKRCLAPGRTFIAYMDRLTEAFRAKYVAAVVLTYGVNQGMGERFLFSAQNFYVLDSLGLDAASAGIIDGFANVPWQLKSLFGLLSDTVPINGLHRSPYMFLAGILGVAANLLLTMLNPDAVGYAFAALLLLLANVNFAVPDVMIDATVAERAKTHPARAADLQALCWGSLGAMQIPAAISKGYLLEGFGVHVLFGLAVLTALCVAIPPMLGWLGEKRRPGPRGLRATLQDSRALCGQVWSHPTKKFIVASAAIVGTYSVTLACIQLSLGQNHPNAVAIFTLVGNALLCTALYVTLRQLDVVLARAVVFTFLKGALCPRTAIMFEWFHAPASDDNRCWSLARCDARSASLNGTGASVNGTAGELPCGWATEREWPCLPPWLLGWVDVASAAALVLGTTLYTSKFQTWTYRSILCLTQFLLVLANLVDLMWVERLNVRLGIPDWLMSFGEETFADVVDQMASQPFFIFAAKLCPPGVEASMFALFMGLSNFGRTSGRYLGGGLLQLLGGVKKPDYDRLPEFVLIRSLCRLLPLALIPFLVPRGTPADSASAMGAGSAITHMPATDSKDRKEYLPTELQEMPSPATVSSEDSEAGDARIRTNRL